jgi:hypothetical protein
MRYVIVTTEDGQSLEVPLKATVVRTVSWVPDSLVLQPDVLAGSAAHGQFEITSTSADVDLQEVRCDDPNVIVDIRQSQVSSSQNGVVHVSVPSEMLGRRTVNVRCLTNRAGEDLLELPVIVSPVNYLDVVPKSIRLGVLTSTDVPKRKITVCVRGPILNELSLLDIKTPSFLAYQGSSRLSSVASEYSFVVTRDFDGAILSGHLQLVYLLGDKKLKLSVPISGLADL